MTLAMAVYEQEAKELAPSGALKSRKCPLSNDMRSPLVHGSIFCIFLIISLCHIVTDLILMISHPIGRGKEHTRCGMAGGIRWYFGSRLDGADRVARSISTLAHESIHNPSLESNSWFSSKSISAKTADAQAEPELPRGFGISIDAYFPLPASNFS